MKKWFGPKVVCLLVACVTVSAAMTAPAHAASCSTTYTWTGGSFDWTNTANWSPTPPAGGPNGATVCVTISSGNPTLSTNVSVLNATVGGTGELDGLHGAALTVNGALSVANDNGMGADHLNQADQPILKILGTFKKSGGSGVTSVYWALKGSGAITASTGVLELDGNYASPGGSLTGAIGGGTGVVRFSAGANPLSGQGAMLGSGATLLGNVSVGYPGADHADTLRVVDGATVKASGTNTFDASTLLVGAGSTFEVLSGTLKMIGASYGPAALTGPGTLKVDGGATFDVDNLGLNFGTPSSNVHGDTTKLDVRAGGVAELTNGGYVAAGELTTLHVFSGGEFDILNPDPVDDHGYLRGTNEAPGFINDGTIRKAGGGTGLAVIDTDVTGSGSVAVDDGTLEIYGQSVSDNRTATLSASGAFGTGQIVAKTIDGKPVDAQAFATTVTNTTTTGSMRATGSKMQVTINESNSQPPPNGYALLPYQADVTSTSSQASGMIELGVSYNKTGKDLVVFNYGRVVPTCIGQDTSLCVVGISAEVHDSGKFKRTVTLNAPDINSSIQPYLRKCCHLTIGAESPKAVKVKASSFSKSSVAPNLGGAVKWTSSASHHLQESQLIGSGNTPLFQGTAKSGAPYRQAFPFAGSFQVNDANDPFKKAEMVNVPIQVSATSATSSTEFAVTWATGPVSNCSACKFEVQFRRKAGNVWPSVWNALRGTQYTTARWGTLTAADLSGTGQYQFRVRIHSGTKDSGWSPLPANNAANINITP